MLAFAIRVPSVDDLFDRFSAEPLDSRPLSDEVRERILRAWIDTRDERPDHLTVELPESERREGLGERLQGAIRHDLEAAYQSSKHLFVYTRSERREAVVAFLFLVVCLIASNLVDQLTSDRTFTVGLSQGLVVLAWVALWQPAQQMFGAVSLWLSRNRFEELADVPIEVVWV